jgi:hypothetical protein
MRQIVPVHMGDTGPKVTILHAALQFLIGHQGNPPNVTQSLLQQLAPDVAANTFGQATRNIVALFQGQLKNWPNYWPPLPQNIATIVQSIPASLPGDVDAGTAEALNWLVETFRQMASPPPPQGTLRPVALLKKMQKGRKGGTAISKKRQKGRKGGTAK